MLLSVLYNFFTIIRISIKTKFGDKLHSKSDALQISIGWLYVISRYFTYRYIVCIGKIPLSAKGITDEITYNHPIDICSVFKWGHSSRCVTKWNEISKIRADNSKMSWDLLPKRHKMQLSSAVQVKVSEVFPHKR